MPDDDETDGQVTMLGAPLSTSEHLYPACSHCIWKLIKVFYIAMVTWHLPTIIKTFRCVYCLALPKGTKGETLAYDMYNDYLRLAGTDENDEDYV